MELDQSVSLNIIAIEFEPVYVSEAGQKVQIHDIFHSSNSLLATTSQEADQIPKLGLLTECTPHFGVNLEVEA